MNLEVPFVAEEPGIWILVVEDRHFYFFEFVSVSIVVIVISFLLELICTDIVTGRGFNILQFRGRWFSHQRSDKHSLINDFSFSAVIININIACCCFSDCNCINSRFFVISHRLASITGILLISYSFFDPSLYHFCFSFQSSLLRYQNDGIQYDRIEILIFIDELE